MLFGIAFIALLVLAGIVEWYVYDRAMWWHEKRDPRNFPPPH